MTAALINFDPINQGTGWEKIFAIVDINGNPIDLTGCAASMQFRSIYHGVIYADMSTDNGKLAILPGGIIQAVLSATDTAALLMRSLIYDLELTWPEGQTDRLFSGTVQVLFEVTL